MSDFDRVLERLLSDPSFQSALAANADAALAGYKLNPEERELLGTKLVRGEGAERSVETRTTKSGVVGLLGPVAAAFGVASGGVVTGAVTSGGTGSGGGQAMGSAAGGDAFGHAPKQGGAESFGDTGGATESFGSLGPTQSMGSGTGDRMGSAAAEATNYETRVDVDGDGAWDSHRAYERGDGGVDIRVDLDKDGIADFVGHDYDRDGLVDVAEFDNNLDGVMETRMYDDSGDGWMDRAEPILGEPIAPEDETQTLGSAPPAG